jgi:hypothetical protein
VGRRGETGTCSAKNQSSSSDDEPRCTENTKTAISVRMTRTATSPCGDSDAQSDRVSWYEPVYKVLSWEGLKVY